VTVFPNYSSDEIDSSARASVVALARSFASDARSYIRPSKGAYLVLSGVPVPGSNGIFSYESQPDPTEIASLAAEMASLVAAQESAAPWCIRLRSDPSPEVLDIAAEHGLTQTVQEPFMVRELDGAGEGDASASNLHVLTCGDNDYDAFIGTVSDTMGAPPELASRLFSRSLVGAEGTSTFLGSVDGVPVATGMGLLHDGYIGIYALTTRAEQRKQGYGRQMMEHIMQHGREAGAHAVNLRSSAMGYALYSSMGFHHAENWITLTLGSSS
jgi:N-acetylglutamate synthase